MRNAAFVHTYNNHNIELQSSNKISMTKYQVSRLFGLLHPDKIPSPLKVSDGFIVVTRIFS